MIRSHIGSTQECEVTLKLERFSYLSGQSFGLNFPIKNKALSVPLFSKGCHGETCNRIQMKPTVESPS